MTHFALPQTLLLGLTLILFSGLLSGQTILINEVMASNSLLTDEDGDTPDWFELYNTSAVDLNLSGWSITDVADDLNPWVFPDISIPAGGFLQVWASDKDRNSPATPRTLIQQGDDCRYIVANQPLSTNWNTLGYDDSAWLSGPTGIGYGDGDDATLVSNGTRALFLRHVFTVADPGLISELLLDMDYDDGFVAYLNGMEVARANMAGTPPAFNAYSTGDHEAVLYTGGQPQRYQIPAGPDLLQAGENVLSIQVHNRSDFSSDLTAIAFLSAYYQSPTNEGVAPPFMLALEQLSLHTDFKLSASGETLYLRDAAGTLVDTLAFGYMPTNLSFGIPSAGDPTPVYFTQPSPAAPNGASGVEGVIQSELAFSHPGGPVGPLSLSLSGAGPEEVIRYTLDASEPDANSPMYSGPLSINSTTVVRAQIFRAGFLSRPSESRTYLMGANHQLPVISLVTEPDHFFHPETGMYVLGEGYQGDFPYFGSNIWEDWERPIHLSFYEPDGTLGVEFNAGTKIFGGWSRANPQRSLSIFARGQYGTSSIEYPLFPHRDFESFQALVLRNSGNDWLISMCRDGVLIGLLEGAGLETQAYRPAVAYLNGEYWGIHNIREKVNEHFLASRFGDDPSEITILEFGGDVVQGNPGEYQELINFVSSNNLSNTANYAYVSDQIDIDNIIQYYVAQIYFDNTDWPGNNIKFWKAPGRKWRWILFDTDFGFGTWNQYAYLNNTLAFALDTNGPGWPNPPWSTLLFRKLTQNLEFRNRFVNRFADDLNSRFLGPRVTTHIDTISAKIASEISDHFIRWGGDSGNWNNVIDQMKNFGIYRPGYVKDDIRGEFNLPAYHELTLENNNPEAGFVQVNSLTIDENYWQGDYFQEVPIAVTAVARPGYTFLYWMGDDTSTNPSLTINMQDDMNLQPVFEFDGSMALAPIINEINYNASDDWDTKDWIELHNPNAFAVDASNWVFKDSDDTHSFTLPEGTTIQGEGYLVLSRDLEAFQNFHPELDNVIGNFDFGLSSVGEVVRLYNAEENLLDSVAYLSESPWPSAPNGQGPSLELINPALNNDLPQNWGALHPHGSPGVSNLVTTDTEEAIAQNVEIHVSPNPFADDIQVSLHVPEAGLLELDLMDTQGRQVHYRNFGEQLPGPQQWNSRIAHLPAGIYILRVLLNGREIGAQKVLKM